MGSLRQGPNPNAEILEVECNFLFKYYYCIILHLFSNFEL